MTPTVARRGVKAQAPEHEVPLHVGDIISNWLLDVGAAIRCALVWKHMSNTRPSFDNHKPQEHHDNALLRLLVNEAIRRGDTLQALADNLGVTYSRLTQWRRNQAHIKNAHRSVLNQAALYLKIPVVVAFVLAGVVTFLDFHWPSEEPIDHQLARVLEDMQQDPLVAGLVPEELASASPTLHVFVAFLYSELRHLQIAPPTTHVWLSFLERAKQASEEQLRASTEEKHPEKG